MPTITSFYGLVIKMYFQQREHNPPHIHVLYQNTMMGALDIRTGKLLEGDLPQRAQNLVREWLKSNQAALLKMWETQEFKKLPPLE